MLAAVKSDGWALMVHASRRPTTALAGSQWPLGNIKDFFGVMQTQVADDGVAVVVLTCCTCWLQSIQAYEVRMKENKKGFERPPGNI